MRVSDSTKVYTARKAKYLINFAMASVDRVESDLAGRIERLETKDSFNEQSTPFEEKTLKYLEERGYLTSLSTWEEERQNKGEIEKRQAKAKIGSKRPALVLDGVIGPSWCSSRKKEAPSPHSDPREGGSGCDFDFLEKTLSRLSKEKEDEIDIWLEFRRWKNAWEDIYLTVKTKGFSVRRVWTVTKPGGKEKAKVWAQNELLPQRITLALKTAKSGWGDYHLISSQGEITEENLFSQKLQSLFKSNSAHFVCPFIYNTVFVSGDKVHYCPAVMGEGRPADPCPDVGSRVNLFTHDLLSKGCEELPQDSQFQAICDSTCRRFDDVFGGNENSVKNRYEKILDTAIDELSLPFLKDQAEIAPRRMEK